VSVELGRNPKDESHGFLGILPTTAERDLDLPFPIEIDSGAVTGPSAGLAFTLGVIDRLTPGDLSGGRKIAVTGTIDEDGRVGPIGGIVQKAVALKDAGAVMFLYPADTPAKEVTRVKRILGPGIELHPVSTISDALAILAPHGLKPAPPLT
jgi:PDZ domain-containing protein